MNDRDVAGGGSDEEAAWRDLVARFDGQPEDQPSTAPWPERENLRTSLGREPPPDQPESDDLPAQPAQPAQPARPAPSEPAAPAEPADLADDDDHFVPPAPPPLPRLEPVLKGAWLALFGGPAYLLVATAAGWTVPGWAAFCAMAAFVSGFVVLVLHLGDDHRDNGSGSDDGAVV
jgi:hypothetical protein